MISKKCPSFIVVDPVLDLKIYCRLQGLHDSHEYEIPIGDRTQEVTSVES